jgi:hypothetical protein
MFLEWAVSIYRYGIASLPMLGLLVTTLLTWEDGLKAKIARQWRHSVCWPFDGGGTLFRNGFVIL